MIALWLILVIPAVSAHAQTPEHLAFLKISIWPEFDQPSVLVMYDGVLADTSNLPRAISVLIPADAQLFVTTWYYPDGTLAPEQPAQQQLIFIVTVLGMAILVGWIVWQQRLRARPVPARPNRRRRDASARTEALCPRCGHALALDANFCSRCGMPRRKVG